jgi:hypothetical protein
VVKTAQFYVVAALTVVFAMTDQYWDAMVAGLLALGFAVLAHGEDA